MRSKPQFSAILQIFLSAELRLSCGIRSQKIFRFDYGQYGSFTVFAIYLRFLAAVELQNLRLEPHECQMGVTECIQLVRF